MLEYREATKAYDLQCDHCGKQDLITTTADPQKAREIATRWKWAFDTPIGDLCPSCAGMWQLRMLDAQSETSPVSHTEQVPSSHPSASEVVQTVWQRGRGSFRRLFLF